MGGTVWVDELRPGGQRAPGSQAPGSQAGGAQTPRDTPLRGDPAPSLCGALTRTRGSQLAEGPREAASSNWGARDPCSDGCPAARDTEGPGQRCSPTGGAGLVPLPRPEACPAARGRLGNVVLRLDAWPVPSTPGLVPAGTQRTPRGHPWAWATRTGPLTSRCRFGPLHIVNATREWSWGWDVRAAAGQLLTHVPA